MRIPAVDELKEIEAREECLEEGRKERQKEEARKKFQEAEKRGDEDGLVVWAGTGVGRVNEVMEAKVRTFIQVLNSISSANEDISMVLPGYRGGASQGHCGEPSSIRVSHCS